MYLVKRRRKWWAMHDIPAELQPVIGEGVRFAQSLGVEDKNAAKRRAAVFEVKWRARIEQARTGVKDPMEKDALFYREALKDATEGEREVLLTLIADEAEELVERAASRKGILDRRDPAYAELTEHDDATRFYALATGKMVPMGEYVEEWLATLDNEAKSKDMKRTTVRKFAERFPYVRDVKRKDVQGWVNDLATEEGKKTATIRRALSELRGYWSYLVSIEAASENNLPFEKLTVPTVNTEDEREPFTPQQVVDLLAAAEAKADERLADAARQTR